MTKNNQKTYERPTLQVLFVETESVMAAGSPVTATGGQIDDADEMDCGTF